MHQTWSVELIVAHHTLMHSCTTSMGKNHDAILTWLIWFTSYPSDNNKTRGSDFM